MVMKRVAGTFAMVVALVVGSLLLSSCNPPPTVLSGTLTSTTGATPLSGVEVSVYSLAQVLVAQTVTAWNGTYSFDGGHVPNGTYRVRFDANVWWAGQSSFASATNVVVSSSSPVTINSTLSPVFGAINGRATDGSAPLAGTSVTALSSVTGLPVSSAVTRADGTYTVPGLYTGSYKVRFAKSGYTDRYSAGGSAWPRHPRSP